MNEIVIATLRVFDITIMCLSPQVYHPDFKMWFKYTYKMYTKSVGTAKNHFSHDRQVCNASLGMKNILVNS